MTEYTLLVRVQDDGSLAPRSADAAESLQRIGLNFTVREVHDRFRDEHSYARQAGVYYLPQLLYHSQFLGSSEFVRELCLSVGGTDRVRSTDPTAWSAFPSPRGVLTGHANGSVSRHVTSSSSPPKLLWREVVSEGWINSVSMLGAGRYAAGGSAGQLIIGNSSTGSGITTIQAHEGWINSLAHLPDTGLIVTGGGDGNLALWDQDSLELRSRVSVGTTWINALAVRSNEVAAACSDGTVWIGTFDHAGFREIRRVKVTSRALNALCWHPIGSIVCAGYDSTPHLVEPATGRHATLTGPNQHGGIWSVVPCAVDGVLTCASDGTVYRRALKGGGTKVWSGRNPIVACSPDGAEPRAWQIYERGLGLRALRSGTRNFEATV